MKKFLKTFAVAAGMAMILGMSSQAAVKKVTVAKPVQTRLYKSHTYKGTPCYHIYIGSGCTNTVKLKPTVTVTGKSSKKVTYKSSNTSIATVSSTGVVKFKKGGAVRITVTSKSNPKKKTSVRFEVKSITKKVSSIKTASTKIQMAVGQSQKVKVTVSPKSATCKLLSYSSSNSKVVTFKNGTLKALKPGKATVKVSAVDGSKKYAKITVTVVKAETGSVDSDKVKDDVKISINGKTVWSSPVKARSIMNQLVTEIAKNNYIPADLKEIQMGNIKLVVNNGLRFLDENGKDITSSVYSGSYVISEGVVNENLDAARIGRMIKGLSQANKNLSKTYEFPGSLTLTRNGKTVAKLSSISVSKKGISFVTDKNQANIIFNSDGTIKFLNCPKVAQYFSNITNGIIS